MITIACIALIGILTIKAIILLIALIFKIILAIWVIIEESKKNPSRLYLGTKALACSPVGDRIEQNSNRKKKQKRIKRQNRQMRNYVIAHHFAKSCNKLLFENNRKR